VSDFIRLLPHMHNVRELSFERPSNDSYLQFDRICDALAPAHPQLTRLRIAEMRRSDADSIVAKLSPWVENLQELALDIVRDFQKDGATATSLECVVQQLIAPARNSLVQLKLHICTLDSLIMSPLILEAHEEWIGIMFGALVRLRLARLRHLYVRTPLRGALSGSEEVPLARFIQAHALERLNVQPSSLSGCRQLKNDWAAKYCRLLSLLTPLPSQHLQELTLHVEESLRHDQGRGLTAVVDFLTAIRGPLTSLVIVGKCLRPDEIARIIEAAHTSSGTLPHLGIHVQCLRPERLMALASALPNLQVLELTTQALCGATQRFGCCNLRSTGPYTGAVPGPPRLLNGTHGHYTQWMKDSMLQFTNDMYAHPSCTWTPLRRLSIQVLVTPKASSDLKDFVPMQTIRTALEGAIPSLIDVTIDFVPSPISKHTRQ
jgi:hypothetical protein